MPPLMNVRHELFCLAIFQGMSQKDAAIKAGYTSKYIRQSAHQLYTNIYILARIKELHELTASPAIMSVGERKIRLSSIGREDIEGVKGPQRFPNISAIAELNKMDGDYAPEKHAVLGNFIIKVVYEHRDRIGAGNRSQAADTP